jgi:hypothetical protein
MLHRTMRHNLLLSTLNRKKQVAILRRISAVSALTLPPHVRCEICSRTYPRTRKPASQPGVVRIVYVDWLVKRADKVIGYGICKGHNELPSESSAPKVTRVARKVGAEASTQSRLCTYNVVRIAQTVSLHLNMERNGLLIASNRRDFCADPLNLFIFVRNMPIQKPIQEHRNRPILILPRQESLNDGHGKGEIDVPGYT